MTAPPDDTTTDLHAVIAALRAERDAAVAREANTRDSDYAERSSASGGDSRGVEGDGGLAGRSAAGVRADRQARA